MKMTAYERRIGDWSSDVCSSEPDGNHLTVGQRRAGLGSSGFGRRFHLYILLFRQAFCEGLLRGASPHGAAPVWTFGVVGDEVGVEVDLHLLDGLVLLLATLDAEVLGEQGAVHAFEDRKSVVQGKSGSVRVNLGGLRN